MGAVIVHVDDDDDIRFAVKTVLTDAGYQVESFASMEALKTKLPEIQPTLFILDVMVDAVDSGLKMHDELEERYPETPKIMMTSLDEQVSMHFGNQKSSTSIVYKPVDPQVLLSVVKQATKPHRA